MNRELFYKTVLLAGDTFKALAGVLGMSEQKLVERIDYDDFCVSDIQIIKDRYTLTGKEASAIFFSNAQ